MKSAHTENPIPPMIIRNMTGMLMITLDAKGIRLCSPIISKPALQKAEIE